MATQTKQIPEQEQITVITVTLPDGKTQRFDDFGDRVYAAGTTSFWPSDQFSAGLAKMEAAGATVVKSTAYACR